LTGKETAMTPVLINWLEFSFPGPEMREVFWLFPAAETLHFLGICLLVGGLAFVDLRLLGYFNRLSVRAAFRCLPIVWFGFAICMVTGALFFSDNPHMYLDNPAFVAKIALIFVAGINALWFMLVVHPEASRLGPGRAASTAAKVSAAASLATWLAVLVLGRLLPVFGQST
jgi:hypothetical protein